MAIDAERLAKEAEEKKTREAAAAAAAEAEAAAAAEAARVAQEVEEKAGAARECLYNSVLRFRYIEMNE